MKKVSLDDTGTIRIAFDFNTDDLSAVKAIPDRKYIPKTREWEVPVSPFHAVKTIEMLESRGFQIAPKLFSIADRMSNKTKFHLKRDGLYDFQSDAIDFLDQTNGRAIIADEQGLGKTIEALYWIHSRPDIKKILVVAPASVIYKWKAETEKWDAGRKITIVEHTSDDLPDSGYAIMSYAIMTRKAVEIVNTEWDCVVLDECHRVKNSKSQRSRVAQGIHSTYLLALSGTPILNRPLEFYNVLHLINPAQWNSWWSYTQRYCNAHETYFGRDVSGASNIEELALRVSPYMIRRLKVDVLSELPELTRTKIPVQVDPAEINQAVRQLRGVLVSKGMGKGSAEALTYLNVLRQVVGMAKAPVVAQFAKDLLDDNPDKKIVIYAVHKAVVQLLSASLYDYGVSTITGEVSQYERNVRQKMFQEKDLPRVMIISSAGGEGIDLYRASTVIFAEREWSPATEEQAEARCHRIGQRDAVESMYVIAEGTVDEDIDQLIESKRSLIGQLIKQADVSLNISNDLMDKILYGGR